MVGGAFSDILSKAQRRFRYFTFFANVVSEIIEPNQIFRYVGRLSEPGPGIPLER